MLEASFGFRCPYNPDSRLYDPELAGGGLLDVGVYTVSAASLFLGEPVSVTGCASICESGVDEQNANILTYDGGRLAVLTSAVGTGTRHDCRIYGTEGQLYIPPGFWKPEQLILERPGAEPEVMDFIVKGNGFNYEIEEAARCIREGLTESPLMPHEESISIMKTMDALREQYGVVYPFEKEKYHEIRKPVGVG
jgi:predicted dehydrogenase